MTNKWPAWRYGPGGKAAIFESEDDVPKDWVDHPSKAEKKPEAKSEDSPPAKRGRKPKVETPLDL